MASDMYGIERLKSTCETILQRGLSVDNAAALLQTAEDQHAQSLKDICKAFIVRHFDVVSPRAPLHEPTHTRTPCTSVIPSWSLRPRLA
jgi:hypothetical protein